MYQDEYYDDKEYDLLTEKIFGLSDIRSTSYDNDTAEQCYSTTNEYLSKYMKNMNLKGKRVATVGSSGDQMLNALFYGAKDVTLIDANMYSRAYVEYKMALIKNFDFYTFKERFDMSRKLNMADIFHWSVYAKISHSLSKPVRDFWDTLILEQDKDFNPFDIYEELVQGTPFPYCDYYSSPKAYNKLRNILKKNEFKLKFITSDLDNFIINLHGKYDAIMLSNIYAYMDTLDKINMFERTIYNLYYHKLNPGGTIQVSYAYREYAGDFYLGEFKAFNVKRQILNFKNDGKNSVYFINKPEIKQKSEENEPQLG